jgi:hypothetical protein
MNISNDILFKAVSAFVDALSEGIAQSVEAKVGERIAQLEAKVQNTLDNAPAIFENLRERQQKLEDRFEHLETASDEQIVEIVKNDNDIADYIATYVDTKFEKFVDDELDDHVLHSVRDLTFNAETTIDIRRY